jgi:hypothetical protein
MKKGFLMAASEWRTVQMFLSLSGVYEVEIDINNTVAKCSCPGFASRGSCKHVRLIMDRIDENGGTYPLKVSSKAPQGAANEANESREAFRNFVIKYGKVEAI